MAARSDNVGIPSASGMTTKTFRCGAISQGISKTPDAPAGRRINGRPSKGQLRPLGNPALGRSRLAELKPNQVGEADQAVGAHN